jgi:hypothetical protein
MNRHLFEVIQNITDTYHDDIVGGARHYIEIDLGKHAEALGYPELKERYNQVNAIVPLRNPADGMKVRVDGRTFVDYAQYDSGVAVPGFVAKDAGMPYSTFVPNDSMILNFN